LNQRIALIAEQAKKSVPHGLGVDKWIETYNQLFAELIVNECADIAQQHNKSPVKSIYAVGHVIREHLGVEE